MGVLCCVEHGSNGCAMCCAVWCMESMYCCAVHLHYCIPTCTDPTTRLVLVHMEALGHS